MSDLTRKALVKLAQENPKMRTHLVPLLRSASARGDFPTHDVRFALDAIYKVYDKYGNTIKQKVRQDPSFRTHADLVEKSLRTFVSLLAQVKRAEESLYYRDKTANWTPPKLTKALAKQVAKGLDKHWAQTGVKSLQDIRDALGKGVSTPMSMSDRIDNQDAIKKWKAGLSKDDLHKVFRWVEEIKNGKGNQQYRRTDEALAKLK